MKAYRIRVEVEMHVDVPATENGQKAAVARGWDLIRQLYPAWVVSEAKVIVFEVCDDE